LMADGLRWDATPRRCREHAIKVLLTTDRREQILAKLKDEPREVVGHFAVYCVQGDVLALKPWVSPPICWTEPRSGRCPGDDQMAALVARMKALRISLQHPDPLAAIEAAEAAGADHIAAPGLPR
jgi:hypothetical protein